MLVHAVIPELNLSAAYWSPNLVFPLYCCEVSGSSEWCLISKSPSIPSWGFRCSWTSTFRNTVIHWGPQLRVRVWASGFNTNPVCMTHHCFICGMGQRLPGDPQCLMAQELSKWRWSWIILSIYCSVCKLTSKISKTYNIFFNISWREIDNTQKCSFGENFPQGLLKCLTNFWLHKEMIWCRGKKLSVEIKQICLNSSTVP